MTKTTASLFTGGGLFDMGAIAAGYAPIWGIEWDDKIAAVARSNGLNVSTADVTKVDFSLLERPDHLHASPPCPNFSIAKANAEETEFDKAMAEAVCRAVETLKPDTFTLENVVGYRKSESFKRITATLTSLGYFWDAANLNSADFGVPQTRRRLFIRASRIGLLRPYPAAKPWVGWYSAIEDLIDTLPETEFAPWQIARLPEEYKTFLLWQGSRHLPKQASEPANTITSNSNQTGIKAFILAGAGNTNLAEAEPGRGVRYEEEPAHTVAAGNGGRIPKAFIVRTLNAEYTDQVVYEDKPSPTVTTNFHGRARAFVVSGGSAGKNILVADGTEPIFTIKANAGAREPVRASIGRVVKMTIQALGRFQTVPDTYKGLTTKINGNGVPCLMAQGVLESFA